MSTARYTCLTLLALVMSLALVGCEADQKGTKNVFGEYQRMMNHSATDATKAAETVLRDELKLLDVKTQSTAVDGTVTARTAQDDDVTVDIEAIGDNLCEVSVRVGVVNKSLSTQILDRIEAELE